MPVALCRTATSSVRAASPRRMRWSRRGMAWRLRPAPRDALGTSRSEPRGWTNVRVRGNVPGPSVVERSVVAPEATRAAVDLEPDLAAAIGAVDAPAARELGQQAQPVALGLHRLRVEALALVGHLDAGEVLGQARDEDDPLIAAQRGVAHRVADDLGREEGDRVLDVLVEAAAAERAPDEPGGLGTRLEGEQHLAVVGGDGHGGVLPRPARPHA